MDPRDRADAVLARAQARGGVVTPDNQASPMDAANTQQIPRRVVDRIDTDPDTTTKLPSSLIEANDVGADERAGADDRGAGDPDPDSHLAEPQPTTPLPRPARGRAEADGTSEPDTRPRTRAVPAPPEVATGAGQAAEQHSHQGELPRQAPDTGADGVDGLVPTVRNEPGQSYLARRLDGL